MDGLQTGKGLQGDMMDKKNWSPEGTPSVGDLAIVATVVLSDRDVADLLACIKCAVSEGQGMVRAEVLRQLGVTDEKGWLMTSGRRRSWQHETGAEDDEWPPAAENPCGDGGGA